MPNSSLYPANYEAAKVAVNRAQAAYNSIKRANYSRQEMVSYTWTEKIKVFSCLNWIYEKIDHTGYKWETRFNDVQYNYDRQLASQRLDSANQVLVGIQSIINREVENELAQASSSYVVSTSNYNAASQVAATAGNKLELGLSKNSRLLLKKTQLIAQGQASAREEELAAITKQQKHEISLTHITALDPSAKAKILVMLFDRTDIETVSLVKHILNSNFDSNFAAVHSLREDKLGLFEHLLTLQKVDCDRWTIGETGREETLVKYVARNHPAMLGKILSATKDFTCTFSKAIDDSDINLLENILAIRPELMAISFSEKINLLQLAVMKNSPAVTNFLLAHENAAQYDLLNLPSADNGLKLFPFALEVSNAQMVNLIKNHVNVGTEIANLISANDDFNNQIITKLISIDPALANGSLVFHALKCDNLEAVRIMLNDESLDEAVRITIHENRLDLLSILAVERPEITQEHMIAQLLILHSRSVEGRGNEEEALRIFMQQEVPEVVDEIEVAGDNADELYANLEHYG